MTVFLDQSINSFLQPLSHTFNSKTLAKGCIFTALILNGSPPGSFVRLGSRTGTSGSILSRKLDGPGTGSERLINSSRTVFVNKKGNGIQFPGHEVVLALTN